MLNYLLLNYYFRSYTLPMRNLILFLLTCTIINNARAQGIYIKPHISAGIVPGYAGAGLGAGYSFKKLSFGIDASTGLFGGTSGNYFQIAEVQLQYKISRSLYTSIAAGFNTLTASTYYGEGMHAGLLLGTIGRLGKLKNLQYYFEAAPKLCFDNIDDFNSRMGLGYYTNTGIQTKFILLFNAGIAYHFGKKSK